MKAQRLTGNFSSLMVAVSLVLFLTQVVLAAPKYKILHNFTGGADGNGNSGVVLDQPGNVYGSSRGGGNQNCPGGCGLVFELTPHSDGKWAFAELHEFTAGDDGADPNDLTIDASGNLYGTTAGGGAHGVGTAYELAPGTNSWTLNTFFAFGTKLGGTQAGLARDSAGNFYGIQSGGGGYGGMAFELLSGSDGWTETVLHIFTGQNGGGDGYDPFAGLILDSAGNLYGTTEVGGDKCGSSTCGTVYELTPEPGGKWKEAILHRFTDNRRDGITPGQGALFMDGSGNLYGTTETGACCGGVVYELTPRGDGRWQEIIAYTFQGGALGNQPYWGVVMDKSGNLYGTTDGGGGPGCGVIYKLAPAAKGKWKYSVLHTFGNAYDGCLPAGNLAIDGKGNLYGGTIFGGTGGYGVIFELTP